MKWSCYWLSAIVYLSVLGKDKLAMAINGSQGTFVPQGLANFSIQWNVTGPNEINITVTADYAEFSGGHGFHDFWVAVGFTKNTNATLPFMFPADVVISSSMHTDGRLFSVEDRHTIEQSAPLQDNTMYDINSATVLLEGTVFTMTFTRRLVTSDQSDQDVSLNVPRYWIWAVGNYTGHDGTFFQHSYMARGVSDTPINPCFAFNCSVILCEPEITTSERFGRYEWFEVDPNNTVAIPCEYGAAPRTADELAIARRKCNSSGEWESPIFTQCRSALPEVTLSPSSEVITIEIGRRVRVSCTVTSFNSSDHENAGWFKISSDHNITIVDSLSFNHNNFMVDGNGLHSLRPNVTVQALGDILFQQKNSSNSDQLDLISWMYDIDDNTYTIPTTEEIQGVYVCRGINSFGTTEAVVTIEIEAPYAQTSSSRSFVRFSSAGRFSNAFPFVSNELQLATIQSSLLEIVSANRTGIQVFNCSNITLMQPKFEERLECLIQEFPPQQSTMALSMEVLSEFQSTYPSTRNTNSSEEGFCDSETTKGPEGTVEWPEAQVNVSQFLICPFGPNNRRISRLCVSQLNWATPNASECANVTQGLQTLNKTLKEINTMNVVEFTSNLTQLVNSSSVSITDQTAQNSQIVSDVLVRTSVLVQSPNVNLQDNLMITSDIVVILDNVEEWPQENIQNQSTTIIAVFENVTTALVEKDNFTNLTVVTNDIALVAERATINSIAEEGRTFVVNEMNGALEVNRSGRTNLSLQENQPAIFTFPSGIDLQELVMDNNGDDVGIFFVVYEEDNLFPVRTNQERSDPVGSAVVSFTIAGLPSGTILPQPISINLRIANPAITGSRENITNATCVFYNFTLLRWDPTGCETIFNPNVNPDEVTCRCSHLTNFASLVDISTRTTEDITFTNAQKMSLEFISYIGVVLSLIGLLLTIITLLIFKKIRKRDVTKFHLQLCISLVCMYIVFVSGIGSTNNRGGCVTVGVLIHYFSLVAWMWMGAEALLMFQKLIIVFGTTTWKYILFISVLCWSIPVVPVLISVSVDPDHYITTYNDNTTRSGFCFISHVGVFFGAFLGPIFLVIVFNTVIYALVIRVIVKRNMEKNKVVSGKYSMTALEVFKLLLSICGIMFLFGLSWIFAVFTFIRDATYVFQLLFAIFSAFQGFWIFFFFILLNSETREAWKSLIECCSISKASTTLTSNSSKSGNTRPTSLLANSATSSTAAPALDSVVPDDNQDHESVSGNGIVSKDSIIRVDSVDIVEELEKEADNESLPEIPLKPLGVQFKDKNGLLTEESWEGDENIISQHLLRQLTRLKKHEVQEIKIDFNE